MRREVQDACYVRGWNDLAYEVPARASAVDQQCVNRFVSGVEQRLTMTIDGSNFVSGCTITYHDPQSNVYTSTPTFVSSSQLTHSFNNGM